MGLYFHEEEDAVGFSSVLIGIEFKLGETGIEIGINWDQKSIQKYLKKNF